MNPHFYTIIRANPADRIQFVYLVGEGPGNYSLNVAVLSGNLHVYGEGQWPIPPGGNPAAELRKFLTERPEAIAKQLVGEISIHDPELLMWQLRDGEDVTDTLARVRQRNREHLVLLDLIEFFTNAREKYYLTNSI